MSTQTMTRAAAAGNATAATIAQTLAAFTANLKAGDIPADVMERAKLLLLDSVGIALASTTFDFAEASLRGISDLDGPGDSAVIGMKTRLPMRNAALLNGILVHGLDFDDTHPGSIVHLTCSLLPAVLAAGARRRSSGREALVAYIAGVESGARLGAAAKGGFHGVGFHPTGVVGAFTTTLAAGRLFGLDAHQLTMAQGIALSAAGGSLEFLEEGAWTKRFHPGWAAVSGLTAVALAQHGFAGPTRAYEGRYGLFRTHLQDRFDPAALDRAPGDLGAVWETRQVAVKPFAACHFTHAAADAAIALASAHKPELGRIERVRVLVPEPVVPVVCEPVANKRRPANSYEAQFSIPYIVAACLVRGRFTLDELESDALSDPAILALADRIDYANDPAAEFPRYYSGEVNITMSDGRTLRQREAKHRGCAERPLTADDIIDKFTSNACRAVSAERTAAIRDLILGLDRAADMAVVANALALSEGK